MSHSVMSTQKMTFNNVCSPLAKNVPRDATEQGRADGDAQPRPLSNVHNHAVADKESANGSLKSMFNARGNVWSSSSIWGSSGIPTSFMSSAVGRDSSTSQDNVSPGPTTVTDSIEGKTGSGSLVDSSVSEDYVHRPSWTAQQNGSAGMLTGLYAKHSIPHQQRRSTSNAGIQYTPSNVNQGLGSFPSRPPMTNLHSSSTPGRQSFGSAFAGGMSERGSDHAPFNVYTKFDRPTDPAQIKPDSATGSWTGSATTPSPIEERRAQFPVGFNRTGSLPVSRDSSLPPSRHTDDAPVFTGPDYSQPSHRVTPNSSRAPSISSARTDAYLNYLNGGTDGIASHVRQLSINSDSRPSTSYKSSGTDAHVSTFSPSTTFSTQKSLGADLDTHESNGRYDRPNVHHLSLDTRYPKQPTSNFPGFSGPAFAERYLQSGGSYEFRPGQPYTGNVTSSRSYDVSSGSSTPLEWQNFTNRPPSASRPSLGVPDQQAYLDPRFQQLMAAQLRQPYAAVYSPYALPNPLQLTASTPYLSLLPLNMAAVEPPPKARDSPVADAVQVQSALMYEFKSNTKTKRYELRDIYGHIAEFSGDQHGSRFIQTKLETANSDEKEHVFQEIQSNVVPLMIDVFGNYVIQKFFEHGDQTHKKILANKMRGHVLSLSLQMYGCRVVQKALEHVLVDQQALLIGELDGHVIRCVKDQNGNHVIQKAIERCPSTTIGFITAAFQGQVQQLSVHTYGCRVIQRCLEKSDLPSRAMIMSELMDGIQTMISDSFGNYVVQHVVVHDDGEPMQRVLAAVGQGFEFYSKHKFASNVVEKCLERADDHWRRQMVFNLGQSRSQRGTGEDVLVGLIKDNFGNYVIQKLLDTLCPEDYLLFLNLLRPAMQEAKSTGCGKQVLSIDKKMHRFDTYRNSGGALSSSSSATLPSFHHRHSAFAPPLTSMSMQPPPPPMPLPLPFASSNFIASAANTPPPLTSDPQSLQSSGLPSVNGDTVGGAPFSSSRKCSEQSTADFSLSSRL